MITTYSELQTAIADWMARNDITTEAATCIQLAEARLNRELKPVEIDASLTGTPSSREIDVTAQQVAEPVALFLVENGNETPLVELKDGTYGFIGDVGKPARWGMDGNDKIVLDRPLDSARTFRFRFRQRFALSDSAPTNWLLDNHPDLYLAISILWGSAYIRDVSAVAQWKVLVDEALPEVRSYIAHQRRSTLIVDPALANIGRRHYDRDIL